MILENEIRYTHHPSAPLSAHARVSIIIPVLNEASTIRATVEHLCAFAYSEVIVIDGGSTDDTLRIVQECSFPNLIVSSSARGRSIQMNKGAYLASGEWLIFLHADTELPARSYYHFLQRTNTTPALESGAFRFCVHHSRLIYRYLEWYVGARCRLLKLPYGDQAIYVRRSTFHHIGAYREDYPLMEDFDLVVRLNKRPGFQMLDTPVYTSARRFEEQGYMRRTLGNLWIQLRYKFGTHPRELAKLYWKGQYTQHTGH